MAAARFARFYPPGPPVPRDRSVGRVYSEYYMHGCGTD